ncbi:CHAT domain-containing protein [Streptomyces sp. NPDC048295]|uniref:CHAT domain-containing protein n=1 Tax=Streptomyces sp. NPDC048295 TaxID=3154617 RepID=UPI0034173E46
MSGRWALLRAKSRKSAALKKRERALAWARELTSSFQQFPEGAQSKADPDFVAALASARTDQALKALDVSTALDHLEARRETDQDQFDVEAFIAAGWLNFLQAMILPGEQRDAFNRGMRLLFVAYQLDPSAVPWQTLPTLIETSPQQALSVGVKQLQDYDSSRDIKKLRLAIFILKHTSTLLPDGSSTTDDCLDALTRCYVAASVHGLDLFLRTGNEDLLEQSIEMARTAVSSSPVEVLPYSMSQLSDVLRLKGEAFSDAAAAEEAVTVGRDSLRAAEGNDLVEPLILSRLAGALRVSHQLAPDLDRIAESVEYGRQAIAMSAETDPNWAARIGNHSASLLLRYRITGQTQDIVEAMEWCTRATAAQHPGDPDPGMGHANLCEILRTRFLPTTDVDGLRRSVEAGRLAVALTPPEYANYARYCWNLAASLGALAMLTDDSELVNEALLFSRSSVDATPPTHCDHPERLMVLIRILFMQNSDHPDPAVLDECLRLSRHGVENTSVTHLEYPAVLAAHAHILHEQYHRTGHRDYALEAVRALRDANEAVSSGSYNRPSIMRVMVSSWHEAIAVKTGSPRDLARLVPVLRELIHESEPASEQRCELLIALTNALVYLHEYEPRAEVLDEAVAASAEMKASALPYHVHMPEYLIAQSVPFTKLYESSGDPVAVEEAISVLRRAHELLTPLHRLRADVAMRLCILVMGSAEFKGPTAVRDAIVFAREAIGLLPAGGPRHNNARTLLSAALQKHSDITRSRRHLEEALAISRALIAETAPDEWARHQYMSDLALGLQRYARLTDSPEHLDEAIDIMRGLVEDPADAFRSNRLPQLAQMYMDRHRATGRTSDFEAARTIVTEVAENENDSPRVRLSAARTAARLSAFRGNWAEAMGMYALAVEQLPFVVGPRLTRESREALLLDMAGLAVAAASCALELDDPHQAVRILEAGRAMLVTQAINLRGPLAVAREHAPHLAAQWQQLRRETANADPETLVQRHRRATRWGALQKELKVLPGMEEFAAPLSDAALRDVTAEGPVVMLTTMSTRADAIIVKDGAVEALRLPMTGEDLVRAANTLLNAQPEAATEHRSRQEMFRSLEWIWDKIAHPVLSALGMDTACPPGQAPRLWWCPTSLFTFLPLGAAGYYGTRDTVLDRAVSSFTPTICALQHARRPRAAAAHDSFLSVSAPDVPGLPPLPGASAETLFLRGRFPGGVFLTGQETSADRVLDQLASSNRVHFACHGISSPYNPSSSSLILHHGSELRATEVSRLDIDGDLAFLSACDTARGGFDIPDEAITVASAFLIAGYRSVVGTLWPIYDTEAAETAQDFYGALAPTTTAAHALHTAVCRTRARVPNRPDIWSAYVHNGA